MKLGDLLSMLEQINVLMDNVVINDIPFNEIDWFAIDNINLLDVPVFYYRNTGEGTIFIETLWS